MHPNLLVVRVYNLTKFCNVRKQVQVYKKRLIFVDLQDMLLTLASTLLK